LRARGCGLAPELTGDLRAKLVEEAQDIALQHANREMALLWRLHAYDTNAQADNRNKAGSPGLKGGASTSTPRLRWERTSTSPEIDRLSTVDLNQ
jgi:hypothetical protein